MRVEAEKKSPSEMSNEELLAQISAHNEAVKALKKFIKPTKAQPTATLVQSNATLLDQRNAAFQKKQNEKKAIEAALIIAEQNKKRSR